ncbi:SpoIIE family protein phosphatase [Streptomyces sp. SCSIO 30461]
MLDVRSLAGQVFLLQVGVVVLVVITALVALVVQARRHSTEDAQHQTLTAAQTFAHSPGLIAALDSPDPSAVLQPSADAVRKAADVDAIIVYQRDGIALTHSDPDQIGKHVIGPYAEAASGKTFTRTFQGALGLSVISAVPVKDSNGSVVAIVSSVVTVEKVQDWVNQQLPVLFGGAVGSIVLAAGGSALVSRRLRRQTHGLGPAEMTRMYEHHDAVLHAVREGVLIVGGDGRLLLANDEAHRLLDLPGDAEHRSVSGLGLGDELAGLLTSEQPATDEVHLAGDRLLAVNKRFAGPTRPASRVVTLRDTTELQALAGRAETARERLQLLYDAGVRIGTTLDVTRTARELAEVAVPHFADVVTVELLDPVLHGEEPSGAGTEMRRTAVVGLERDDLLYPAGTLIRFVPSTPTAVGAAEGQAVRVADLSTSDGWQAQHPERARRILEHGVHSLVVVPLQARGVVLGTAHYWRKGASAPFDEEDVTFAEELATRAAVCIDNARRYTREHTTAVALQRSLLPSRVPDLSALRVAYRYLPARAGVGGDWFDVIPLSGARVALVVGDVVGHGVHAAATMGRLRTAVHNFSVLDIPPEELLGRVDELVAQIDVDESDAGEGLGITGATCLYAVYDPTSGRLTVATAGHPGPAVVHPDGSVDFPQLPVSPPLGLGASMPGESAELNVPEGSRLVLYTDGLIEDRDRDPDIGLTALRAALTGPDRSPEATCAAVVDALVPDRPRDDIALLVARTHRLDADRIAEWPVPRDPAAVGPVRAACVRRIREWGLEQLDFAAELVLSELITNAVNYGSDPVTVRLLRDRALICEVSDGSSTSPRLRRARVTDEGGRGLFLVAQFAERWGTRYTSRGKVIWAELSLHGGGPSVEGLAEFLFDEVEPLAPESADRGGTAR